MCLPQPFLYLFTFCPTNNDSLISKSFVQIVLVLTASGVEALSVRPDGGEVCLPMVVVPEQDGVPGESVQLAVAGKVEHVTDYLRPIEQ